MRRAPDGALLAEMPSGFYTSVDSTVLIKRLLKQILGGPRFAEEVTGLCTAFEIPPPSPVVGQVETCEVHVPGSFPLCELVLLRSTRTLKPAEQQAQGYQHRIYVTWSIVGDREQTVTDLVETYVLATRRLLEMERLRLPVQVTTVPIWCGDEDFSRLVSTKNLLQPLIKGGRVELLIGTIGGPPQAWPKAAKAAATPATPA